MAVQKFSERGPGAALTGDEIVPCVQAGEDVQVTPFMLAKVWAGAVSPQSENFTVNGPSGTCYTDRGSAGTVQAQLESSPVGTVYSFFAVSNGVNVFAGGGDTIQFWDGNNSQTTCCMGLLAPGKSAILLRETETTWIALAANGAVNSD